MRQRTDLNSYHQSSSCSCTSCVWWEWWRAAPHRRTGRDQEPAQHTSHPTGWTWILAWVYRQTLSSNLTDRHAGRNPEPSFCNRRGEWWSKTRKGANSKRVLLLTVRAWPGSRKAPVWAWEGVDVCSIPEVSAGLQDKVGRAMGQHLDIICEGKALGSWQIRRWKQNTKT